VYAGAFTLGVMLLLAGVLESMPGPVRPGTNYAPPSKPLPVAFYPAAALTIYYCASLAAISLA